MSKRAAKIIDLDQRREARDLARFLQARFLQRCDEAAGGFKTWVLDADHQPVLARDITEWAAFKTDFADNCRVGLTDVGEVRVSTVFLGYDAGYSDIRGGPPLLFETIIFGPGASDITDRYATWDEAVAGHAAVVEELEAKP